MSNSSSVLGKSAETREGRTFEGAAFSKTLLNLVVQRCRRTRRDPSSSIERRRKVARSWVRVNVMTRPYRRAAGLVKSARSKTRDAAVQIVLVRAVDFCGDDLADLQRTAV